LGSKSYLTVFYSVPHKNKRITQEKMQYRSALREILDIIDRGLRNKDDKSTAEEVGERRRSIRLEIRELVNIACVAISLFLIPLVMSQNSILTHKHRADYTNRVDAYL